MNYYVLPGIGIHGDIKVGFQFAQLLSEAGVPIAAATPGGVAPSWFRCAQPVVDRQYVLANAGPSDTLVFSLPHDYPVLKATGARLIFHCQGTGPLIDQVLHDRDVTILSCWEQAARYARTVAGREAIDVGISIADIFFYDGAAKDPYLVAFMPRQGAVIAERAMKQAQHLRYVPIDNETEEVCAAILKRSGFFLAMAAGEWSGLPALEAMAAGCVVVSVPVVAMEHLRDGDTACVVEPARLPSVLDNISGEGAGLRRAALRDRGAAMASRYRTALHRRKLEDAMQAGLKDALSWN